jgi:hypothetical protein
MPLIHTEFEHIKKNRNSLELQQEENIELSNDIITSFKSELEDIETRLRLGSLGGFVINENLNEWQTKLKQSIERIDLAECLLQLQQTVADKYTSGIFNLTDKKSFQLWVNDCRTCKTSSRLYVLMMIFENCITWNKSTLGVKCKICRRKHKDEYIIVCDQCCYGYHQECLRGYSGNIKTSTNDLWYCLACQPQSASRRRGKQEKKNIDYNENDIYDMEVETTSTTSSPEHNDHDLSSSNSDDNIEGEDNLCCVCDDGENDLIQCTQCHQYYHCQCHEPPLRCLPRSTTWICNNCRNGISNDAHRSKTRKPIKKSQQKTRTPTQKQNGTRRSKTSCYKKWNSLNTFSSLMMRSMLI